MADWSPQAYAFDVPTDVTARVTFSDYPDPDTVGEPSMLLTSGVYRVPETYRVDLADKAVLMTPVGTLSSQLGYSVTVMANLLSLAGCAGTFAQRQFTTGSGPANLPAPAVPALADVQAVFTSRCGGPGNNCHLDPSGGCLAAPRAGLSLCAEEARDALVEVPSREVSALALVAPLDSARSYLMRKLLPATAGGGPIPGTLGEREPPGPPLAPDQIRTIAAWIDGGALP
ncbi:MAG TPA: Ig-like domain-containing protein [Polyangia bacterium]|nr:Ig-like domain-containing protein [Polyangia bacterium]